MPSWTVAWFVGATTILLASAAGAKEPPAGCDLGRYVLDGPALLEDGGGTGAVQAPHSTDSGSSHGRVVNVVGDEVGIEGVCGRIPAKVRHKRKRTKIRAKWNDACDGVPGKVTLRATIDASDCRTMRGVVKAKKMRPHKTRFSATRTLGDPADCTDEDTFEVLQKQIFGAKGCRVSTCHGSVEAGGLDLRWGAAHFSLVDQPAMTPGAAGKQRVVPGDPDASFLWQKLSGELGADEGVRMPAAGPPLDALELEFVRSWIAGGAPAVGRVDDAPCLPHPEYKPVAPPDPPPGGYQMVLEGPILQPGEEVEGCMWARAPNTEDFAVGAWEYWMNPGTHHFAVWDHVRGEEPELGVFRPGDVACFGGGAPTDGRSLTGAGEAPYFVDDYPAGTGRIVRAGQLLGLNPHYFNEFDVPIQIKIWINMHPVAGALEHEVETLFSSLAPFGDNNAYNFAVPPFSTATHRLRMHNPLGRPMSIFEISSHQHQRGTHFTAWNSAGEKIFENYDWAHPAILNFDEPWVLAADDWIDFECEWDNGITREVRRCGDSPNDSGCTPGDPRAVTFGITAQDEMCFLTGFYFE